MAHDKTVCPLCDKKALLSTHNQLHRVRRIGGCQCTEYYIHRHDLERLQHNTSERHNDRKRLMALLRERHHAHKSSPTCLLVFEDIPPTDFDVLPTLKVDELLTTWPTTLSDRVSRVLCNLINSSPGPGYSIEIDPSSDRWNWFTNDSKVAEYILRILREKDQVEVIEERGYGQFTIMIRPSGWITFEEITRTKSKPTNLAFVAMWFGGKDYRREMTQLHENALRPGVEAAGYKVKRADTDEHNEPIMDRVIHDIRRCPFLVAELSDDNNGVYYEAGFARGLGTEVIYCCKDGHKPHFDVSGINLVKWEDEVDLKRRLRDRILGTLGEGPFDSESRR